MGSIRTILESVIDNGISGKKVEIKPITRGEYETIRTRLVKLWSKTRENLLAIGSDADPLTETSLCGNYYEDSCCGIFYLGIPRRKVAKVYSFQIIDQRSEQEQQEEQLLIAPIITTKDTLSHDYEPLESSQQSDKWNLPGYLERTQE